MDYATVRYDTDGNLLWARFFPGLANGADEVAALTVDSQGNVYVTGLSWGGSTTSHDYATVKYDRDGNELWVARYNGPSNLSSGNLLWVARYNGTGNGDDIPTAVVVDGRGNVDVTGRSWSGTDFDYLTVKYIQVLLGDVNGNGCVDDGDLLAVLFVFGQRGSGLAEDLNNDGVVDDADLLEVLFNFGSGC
jgi:hypothetical protein